MSIKNKNSQMPLPYRVFTADRFLTRMIGLLGHAVLPADEVLLLESSGSIHTFGMKFPIDVLFLDAAHKILQVREKAEPNRIFAAPPQTAAVLELTAGQIQRANFQTGDHLEIIPDAIMPVNRNAFARLAHWPVNLALGLLWGNVALRSIQLWIAEKSLVGLGLLLVNSLVFALFLSRRPSQQTSKNAVEWVVAFATVLFSFLLKPHLPQNGLLVAISLPLQVAGILLMVLALGSLGRSFGIVPSNRTIKVRGAFQLVRHPLYVSELVYYFAFLLSNLTPLNALLVGGIFIGQLYRAGAEEKLLSADPAYRNYCALVRYRFIPGLY